MIDVQPYIDKLEGLKEYMRFCIDSCLGIWIDIDTIPGMSPEAFFRLYAETGIIFYNGNIPPTEYKRLSFDEWYELNKN